MIIQIQNRQSILKFVEFSLMQQMTKIKSEGQGQNQINHQQKPRPNIKAAIRLVQKQQTEIVNRLEQLHNKDVIKHIDYDQQKTQLQKYLDLPSQARNKKICKSIKAELSYLPCFQVHAQSDMPKELLAIMKRDIDMLIAVISKFVYAVIYPKGSIIQRVCMPRKSVKILLKGQVSVFEPINYKSYKNCLKNNKQLKIKTQWFDQIIAEFNQTPQHFDSINILNQLNTQKSFNPQQANNEYFHNLRNKHKPLYSEFCKKILMNSTIITPTTPHRQTLHIKHAGHLICSERQSYVINQTKSYEHTAICLTQVYVVQLQYDLYKLAISLLNSDQQKRYIQTILKKFEMLEYFDAKQYVKKQYMIDKKRQEQQMKKKQQEQMKLTQTKRQQLLLTKKMEPVQKITIQKMQSEQSQTSSVNNKDRNDEEIDIETYEIKYDGDVYLIVSGEITLVIDKIGQTRLSKFQHASKIRSFQSHQILKLYSTDIFGFQQIGKIKEYNLRYRVKKNSKLLLMSQNIYVKQFNEIPGFRSFYKQLTNQRNLLVSQILKKIEKNIQNQQLKRYQSLSSIQLKDQKSPKNQSKTLRILSINSQSLIKKVQFVGKNGFEMIENKLIDKLSKQKEGKSANLSFKQMIKSGQQLKDSLSFASIYKSHLPKNCEIVGNYIQVRNKNGVLKRKKCIIEDNNHQKQRQKQIFRKLGIISDQDRNNHNFELISNRRSKYILEDFQKQKKQMNRLSKISHSLPKLDHFYAKKQEILYNNIHKRDY